MQPKRFSVVSWNDAHASLDQLDENEIRGWFHRPHVIHTYGFVVNSDEVGVTIAGEWLPPADDDEHEAFRAVSFIPRGMVLEEKTLKPQRIKKAATRGKTSPVPSDGGASGVPDPQPNGEPPK